MKQVCISILLPVFLFMIIQALATIYANRAVLIDESISDISWINNVVYFSYIVVGYLSGYMSRSYKALTGALAGSLAGVVAVLVFGVGVGDSSGKVMILTIASVLGGLGSVFSKFDMKSKRSDF